jgi:hypothetical protein
MIHRHSLVLSLAGFTAAAAVAALIAPTAGAATAGGQAAAARAPTLSRQDREVLLITGDRVLAVPTARGAIFGGLVRDNAESRVEEALTLHLGRQVYEIPAVALPYLGRGLDPGLFRLGALLGREAGGRLPVRISYRGALPSLPGVRITSSGGGTARGYLTAASARAFGAALSRHYAADQARGSYGTDGLFGGGTSIALAGTTARRPPVAPDFPMATLTVTGTDLAGKPDTGGEVVVINADNSRRFSDLNESESFFFHGTAKFSVPIGHYWAVAGYFKNVHGMTVAARLDVLPQFTVAGNTTVRTTAKAATSKLTMVTPRPTQPVETDFTVLRGGKSGPPVSIGLLGSSPIWVNPANTPLTVGSLHAYAAEVLYSSFTRVVPYQYALEYGDPPGLISPQRYVERPQDVAAVNEMFYQTRRADVGWSLFGSLPDGTLSVGFDLGFARAPGRNVLYAGGNLPALAWQRQVIFFRLGSSANDGGQTQGFARLPAGTDLTERWGGYPLHPDANANLDPANVFNPMQPSATRIGNTLRLDTTPFTDNQPGDLGVGFVNLEGGGKSTGRYEIDQNGRKIAAGNAVTTFGGGSSSDFSTQVTLRPKPSVIRVTLSAAVAGRFFALSTASRTVWTWRSAYQPAARLPRGWFCTRNPVTLAQNHDCAVQPMMTLRYDVHRLALNGSAPAGRQAIGITVGHLQLARAARIARASVSVSFDNGKTWHRATVTRSGPGQFAAAFSAPAGAYVMLRTSAADAAGGGITETITRAYKIAS